MPKIEYIAPEMEIIKFENEDIIITSTTGNQSEFVPHPKSSNYLYEQFDENGEPIEE